MTAPAPPLAPDLAAGLRRLKLAAMRQLAPELLITAKTQRWAPEELLRTLIEAEITARDASNAATRMRNASFPVIKTLDELDRSACSIPGPTLDYLATLEWITARDNLCLVGPAGTGKSHVLVALGISAVHAGHKVRYFTAADLVDTLYRGLADNSVGKVIENLLRNDEYRSCFQPQCGQNSRTFAVTSCEQNQSAARSEVCTNRPGITLASELTRRHLPHQPGMLMQPRPPALIKCQSSLHEPATSGLLAARRTSYWSR